MVRKKILVFSASIGSGHIKAAEALCQTYKEKFGGEIHHVDFWKCLNPAFIQLIGKGYFLMTKHVPFVYKFFYKNTNKPSRPIKNIGNYLNIKEYEKLIEKYKPDIILSTNFVSAAVVSWMHKRFPITNGVVITDYITHSIWAYPNNDKFFVAYDGMVSELEKLGVDRNKICVSGIPVRPCFTQPQDKIELRKKLDLKLKKPTILLMGGGSSMGPFVEVLESLSKVKFDFQVLVIVGHNKKVYRKLRECFDLLKLKGQVLGFVENVDEYMMASDILISKAGGLTVSEALAVGLPMVIIKSIPGQEDGNIDFVTKAGAGVYAKDESMVNLLIEDLLGNSGKLSKMAQNAKKIALPNAAETILNEMIKLK